jgi:hypothetical protein
MTGAPEALATQPHAGSGRTAAGGIRKGLTVFVGFAF